MAVSDDLAMFAAGELLDAHEHLDKASVPRRCPEGELLSIAQRCKLTADMVVTLATSQALMTRWRDPSR